MYNLSYIISRFLKNTFLIFSVFRFISHLEENPIDIIKNVSVPINSFAYDGINSTIYYVDESENCIMMTTLDNNNYPKTTETTLNFGGNGSVMTSLTIDTLHNR